MSSDRGAIIRSALDFCIQEKCMDGAPVCAGWDGCSSSTDLGADYIIDISRHHFRWIHFSGVLRSCIFDASFSLWKETAKLVERVHWDGELEGRLLRINTTDAVYLVRFYGRDPSYTDGKATTTKAMMTSTMEPYTSPSSTHRTTRRSSSRSPRSSSSSRPTHRTTASHHVGTSSYSPSTAVITSTSVSTPLIPITSSSPSSSTHRRTIIVPTAYTTTVHPTRRSSSPSRSTADMSTHRTSRHTSTHSHFTASSVSPSPPPNVSSSGKIVGAFFGGLGLTLLLRFVYYLQVRCITRRRTVNMFHIPPDCRVVEPNINVLTPENCVF